MNCSHLIRLVRTLMTPTGIDWASQAALVVKNLLANAVDIRDATSIPRWGRSPGGGNGKPCSQFN